MTRSQQYLIGAVLALLGVVVCIFRADLFLIVNRPGLTSILQNYIQPYGLGIFIVLFAYLLSKSFGIKWWVFILLFCLWELSYILVLNYSSKFLYQKVKHTAWFGHFRSIAIENRSMIQYQPESAQYDKELFYILKPGSFSFKSYEFNNNYSVNSLGVRDDEESLNWPEILFLGDSITMGWGVDQDDTFPAVFERRTKFKSLNTGISSYGTARESRIMTKVKVDSLKAVIIQFHDTDLEENDFFVKNKRLGQRSQEEFDNQVSVNNKVRKYYPFKYIKIAAINFVSSIQRNGEVSSSTERSLAGVYKTYPNYISDFYQILKDIKGIKNVPVIFTYIGSFYTEHGLLEEFQKYAHENNIQDVYFLNLARVLEETDYFYFDDHINSNGHAKVASALELKVKEVLR